MENHRPFLFISLILVLFLIWQSWSQEQAALKAPPAVVATPGQAAGDVPAGAPTPRADVPATTASAASAPAVLAAEGASDRVRVITDQFEIEIDTQGGDLRHAGLRTHGASNERRDEPYQLLKEHSGDLFIAQTGLVAVTGEAPTHHARYSAERSEYRLPEGQDRLEVPLVWSDASGVTVTKTYTFRRGSFVIDVAHKVENAGTADWRASQYRQFQRIPPASSNSAFGVYTYTGGVISTHDKNYEKVDFDDMAKADLSREVTGGWAAMIQHYFIGAWVPTSDEVNTFYTKVADGGRYVLGLIGQPLAVSPGASGEFRTTLYVGPKLQDRLEELAPYLELTVDYGFLTIIAKPLFWLLQAIHGLIGNWGWAIVFLTVLIKAVFFKLSETSYRSMANMRRMQPRITALRDKYGSDRQKLNQAMMELYKKEKINPLGGCLPILVQIPVFIALYWMLLESVELRHAPFMLWITDLSTKDPWYVLPVIMGITMFIQQKLNPAPPDPIQAKVMMALPIVFTVMFLWFPSGLVLYWVVNNTLSIAQQYVITRRVEASGKAA